MADLIFIQRGRMGRSVFAVDDGWLEINSNILRDGAATKIPLKSISPEYHLTAARVPLWMMVVAGLLAVGLVYACLRMSQHDRLHLLVLLPLWAAVFCAGLVHRFIPRMELFIFRDHWKKPLFTIAREREQAAECDAFVTALLERIEQVREGTVPVHPKTKKPAISAVRVNPESEADVASQNFWKISLAAGAAAAGFPLFQYLGGGSAELSFMVVMSASPAGIVTGSLSFLSKEPMRWWALAGMALALVPIVFY